MKKPKLWYCVQWFSRSQQCYDCIREEWFPTKRKAKLRRAVLWRGHYDATIWIGEPPKLIGGRIAQKLSTATKKPDSFGPYGVEGDAKWSGPYE
jgi:hypothetical protein